MKEQGEVITYLLDKGASTRRKNNLNQKPCDLTNTVWVHDKLNKERKDRRDARIEKERHYKEMERLQQMQEEADRKAWTKARGTSSAVPSMGVFRASAIPALGKALLANSLVVCALPGLANKYLPCAVGASPAKTPCF